MNRATPWWTRLLTPAAALVTTLASPSRAHAQKPPRQLPEVRATLPDRGYSADECKALLARHERVTQERQRRRDERSNAQNPTPWTKAEDFDDLGDVFDLILDVNVGILSALTPNLGLRVGDGRTDFVLSWAWSVPFGPDVRCDLSLGSRYLGQPRHRALLEPGFLFGPHVGGFVRPGYRYLFGLDKMGLGVGLGTTLERSRDSPWRASVSPELFLHHGRCCHPGYLTVALRYDRFFAGRERDMWTLSVGVSAF